MSHAVISMAEVGHPDSFVDQSALLRESFVRAVPGMQLVQHSEISTGGVFTPEYGELAGHDYLVSPYYSNRTDETGKGWVAAQVAVDRLQPRSRLFRAVILGSPSLGGPDLEIVGRDLPPDVATKLAVILGIFATGTDEFLAVHPQIAQALRNVNRGRPIGRERTNAIRRLRTLVARAARG